MAFLFMAENKRSFVAYVDWKDTFNALPDDVAGRLVKHLFAYVNDENPKTDDILITAVFAGMKLMLKRDLIKYQGIKELRVKAGVASSSKKQHMPTHVDTTEHMPTHVEQTPTHVDMCQHNPTQLNTSEQVSTVYVNVNENVNENVKKEKKKKHLDLYVENGFSPIEKREQEFMNRLEPYVHTYGQEMLRKFFDYWTEKNPAGRKMKFEMQKTFEIEKRLRTWNSNSLKTNGTQSHKEKIASIAQGIAEIYSNGQAR